jgi:hypothetical protein
MPLFMKDSTLNLFSAGTFIVMTLTVYVCGNTYINTNAVHHEEISEHK